MAIETERGNAVGSRARVRITWSAIVVLTLIIMGFVVARLIQDVPRILDGTVPSGDSFAKRYDQHWALAYAHILPAVVYLIGASFQISRGFRTRHYTLHRWLGRILVPVGIVVGAFALIFGIAFPYGGARESVSTAVFGAYFMVALVVAFRAIRSGDVAAHRRWMIRAFAIGIAVGTIRIWIGLFGLAGLASLTGNFSEAFGWAFLISFPIHAVAAEIYLAWRPDPEAAPPPDSVYVPGSAGQ